jgi:PKD repeat protein
MPAGTNYFWDFGEPGSPTNTSTLRTGSHQYCTPGVKTVTLTLVNGTMTTKNVKKFTVGQLPYIYLGKDDKDTTKTICDGQFVELNAFGKVGKPNYPIDVLWYPSGKTTDTIKVRDSGCYSVQITDRASGCTAEAKMQIKICGERDRKSVV